jgi:heat-inducible transcriptional repressor
VLNERLSGSRSRPAAPRGRPPPRRRAAAGGADELLNIFVSGGGQLFERAAGDDAAAVLLGSRRSSPTSPSSPAAPTCAACWSSPRRATSSPRSSAAARAAARLAGPEISITIGAEHGDPRMAPFTVVTAEYRAGALVGVIGVIGPTRMPYDKVIALVSHTSRLVTDLLH